MTEKFAATSAAAKSGQPERIAQVLGDASFGGVIVWLMNFFRNIDRTKFLFDFYMYAPSPFDDEIRALGGRVFYYPRVTDVFGAYGTLKKAFRDNGYSKVHVHMTTLSFVALAAAKSAGVPRRICHSHSTANPHEGWKYAVKMLIRPLPKLFATDLAGCSELAIRWLYGSKCADKATLVHNAVDLDRYRVSDGYAVEAKKRLGLSGRKVIGFAGRFERQKNLPWLIDVFAEVAGRRDDAVLILAGAGSEKQMLLRRAEEKGVADKIFFLGKVDEVKALYAAMDVFVLPSLFEGLPLVAIEAQAAGLFCLMSDNITREAAVTDNCAFLPLDDVNEWADAVLAVLEAARNYDGPEALSGGPYDIKAEARRLEEFYSGAPVRGGGGHE